jgi:diacylglycerol kinase family enzyme
VVLVNPARVPRSLGLSSLIQRHARASGWREPIWIETVEVGDDGLDEALGAGADVLLACGGDGTVARAIQALAQWEQVALGIVPLGSGNLLARNLNLPRAPEAAVLVVTTGIRRRIDLGEVGGIRFAVAAGIGIDAKMLADAPGTAKRVFGWLAYVPSAAVHLLDPEFGVSLEVDQGPALTRRVRSVLVSNVGRLPGGIRLRRDISTEDGLLDVVVIAPRRPRDFLRLALRLGLRHPEGVGLETFRCRTVKVVAERSQPREADGEPLAPARELVVGVLPRALLVCTQST